jgi:hypothetical protein
MKNAPRALLLLMPIALAGCIAGLLMDPYALMAAYLAAAVACSAVPIGALAVLMVTYLVRGAWTEELHDALAASALTLPAMALLFVPVLIAVPWLYPWAAEGEHHGALQAVYLTPWFFIFRTIMYFAVWTALALWARDAWGNTERMTRAATVGLIVYALTASLAGIDWIESLRPGMHSSIYGLLFIGFQLLAGFGFGALITLERDRPALCYGEILLSLLLLWAYLHAMQYVVIWAADIPDEVTWYLRRASGGWAVVLWGLVLLQFVLPFFALLSERIRYGERPLWLLCGATLAMRLVEAFWLVLPSTRAGGWVLMLDIPAVTLGVAAVWTYAFARVSWRSISPTAPASTMALSNETSMSRR